MNGPRFGGAHSRAQAASLACAPMTDPTPPEPPPSAAWGPPPGPPPAPSGGALTITLLPGQVVALAGGVLSVVSAWLDWIRPSRPFGPPMGFSAYDVPVQFLFRNSGLFVSRTGPSLGVLVFLLGAACMVAALVRPVRILTLPAGAGALVVAVWYALRLRNYASSTFRDLLGVGTVVAVVGGLIAIVGGTLTLARR
jgi:hypothetical protein